MKPILITALCVYLAHRMRILPACPFCAVKRTLMAWFIKKLRRMMRGPQTVRSLRTRAAIRAHTIRGYDNAIKNAVRIRRMGERVTGERFIPRPGAGENSGRIAGL